MIRSPCLGLILGLVMLTVAASVAEEGDDGNQSSHELSPTHLHWQRESISTREAEEWLNAHNQPTRIVAADDVERPFAFSSGSYWQAIVALCETFELSIDPPSIHAQVSHSQRQHASGTAYVAMGGGQVVLRPRLEKSDAEERWQQPSRATALRLQACGIFLVEIIDAGIITSSDEETYVASIAYRVRSEPGQELERLAAATITWDALLSNHRQRLEWPPDQRGEFRHRMHGGMRASTNNRPPEINIIGAIGSGARATRIVAEGGIAANYLSTQSIPLELAADGETTVMVNGHEWTVRNRQEANNNHPAEILVQAGSEAADDLSGLRIIAQSKEGASLLSGSTGTSRSHQGVSHRVGMREYDGTISITLQVTSMREVPPVAFSLEIDLQ